MGYISHFLFNLLTALVVLFQSSCVLKNSVKAVSTPETETVVEEENNAPTLTLGTPALSGGCGALTDDLTGTGETSGSRREFLFWWGGGTACPIYLQIADSDGDTFDDSSFSCTNLPTGSTTAVDSGTLVATITFPDPGDGNAYLVDCTVTDGEDTDTFYIQIIWGL